MRGAGLPKPKSLADHLQKNALQSAVNGGLRIAVEGTDPGDALRQGLINAGVNSLAGFAAGEIGDNRKNLSYGEHKFLHGIAGAIGGQVLYKDAASGAMGGAARLWLWIPGNDS